MWHDYNSIPELSGLKINPPRIGDSVYRVIHLPEYKDTIFLVRFNQETDIYDKVTIISHPDFEELKLR